MDSGWERAVECGVPYYKNHKEQRTQWDHPKFPEIIQLVRECNIIKYAAYRTAAKMCVLQRALHMENVRLGIVVGVLKQHRLRTPENSVLLEATELEALLADIFFAARRERMSDEDIDLSTELMLNFILNVYDPKRLGGVTVLQSKVALAVLSSSRLQEKHQFLFRQVADHNNCVSRKKLEILLQGLATLVEYLSEGKAFGPSLVPATVDSCFQLSQGILGVTEDGYMSWLLHEPQLLVWLSTFYRMRAADLEWHNVKCAVCKSHPIRGLRYRCLHCLGYEQCQMCFLTGQVTKKHKTAHPMQEYVGPTSSMESTRAFLKVIKNRVCRTSSKIQYLPVLPQDCTKTSSVTIGPNGDVGHLLNGLEVTSRTVLHGSTAELNAQSELQSIIVHLEQVCGEEVGASRQQVEAQVERLKALKKYFTIRGRSIPHRRQLERFESTPIVCLAQRRHGEAVPTGELSPIPREVAGPAAQNLTDRGPRGYGEGAEDAAQSLPSRNGAPSSLPSLSECYPNDCSSWNSATLERGHSNRNNFSAWLSDTREPGAGAAHASPSSNKADDSCRDQRLQELHEDLDGILDRLQHMLAFNFADNNVEAKVDNTQLKKDANEIEDLVSGLIEKVELQKHSDMGLGDECSENGENPSASFDNEDLLDDNIRNKFRSIKYQDRPTKSPFVRNPGTYPLNY